MTFQSRNVNTHEASLELSLAAHKSLVADYSQRTKQAELATSMLMRQKMDKDGIERFAMLVATHMEERAKSMAVHQQAMLQTTLMALNSAMNASEEDLRGVVNNVVRAITTSLAQMNSAQGKPSRPQPLPNKE